MAAQVSICNIVELELLYFAFRTEVIYKIGNIVSNISSIHYP